VRKDLGKKDRGAHSIAVRISQEFQEEQDTIKGNLEVGAKNVQQERKCTGTRKRKNKGGSSADYSTTPGGNQLVVAGRLCVSPPSNREGGLASGVKRKYGR